MKTKMRSICAAVAFACVSLPSAQAQSVQWEKVPVKPDAFTGIITDGHSADKRTNLKSLEHCKQQVEESLAQIPTGEGLCLENNKRNADVWVFQFNPRQHNRQWRVITAGMSI